MSSPDWKLDKSQARLDDGTLSASLDLAQPTRGLYDISPFFTQHPQSRLLQIVEPEIGADGVGPSDSYLRSRDLIVTYPETDSRRYSLEVYWRSLASEPPQVHRGVELIVSAQTSTLDATPRVTVRSTLPAGQFASLPAAGPTARSVPIETAGTTTFDTDAGPGCFIFRPPGAEFSYVEMVHPTDFQRCDISEADGGEATAEHLLIRRWMEKGVIVRARMRACFVQRDGDLTSARACYDSLCHDRLPLTV